MMSKYPQRSKFMFHTRTSAKLAAKPSKYTLLINSSSIEPQFANLDFVYRVNNINYLSDYYNVFFVQPADLITQAITKYISTTNLFHFVTSDAHPIEANLILKSHITALYADYRDNHNPKARIAIHFTIFAIRERNSTLILNKTLSAAIPIRKKDSKNLVYAWNCGLNNILRQLAYNLKKIVTNK